MSFKDYIIDNNNHTILNKRYSLFIYFLFIIQFKEILLNYFENNIQVNYLSHNASIIDITDYHNLYLLITTEKIIYTGIPPNKKSKTTSNIINITAAATYNKNYVILACTGDYFLSKININTGEEVPLVNYSYLNLSIIDLNYTCSISILNNYIYIGICQMIKKTSLRYNIIKIELELTKNNEPILGNTIIKHVCSNTLENIGKYRYPRLLSCEAISSITNINSRLVCGYIAYETTNFVYFVNVMTDQFNSFGNSIRILTSPTLYNYRLQKINSTFLRYLMKDKSYEIYLNNSYDVNIVSSNQSNTFLYEYTSGVNTFYYHNQYIFYANPNGKENFYLYIKSNLSNSTIRFQEKKNIHYCMGYYDDINDKLEMFYQYENIIKYFIAENKSSLFYYQCGEKTIEVLFNKSLIFNASELITYPLEYPKFYKVQADNYHITNEQISTYDNDKLQFNESSQILSVITDFNDSMAFNFYYLVGLQEDIIIDFVIPKCFINIKISSFKIVACTEKIHFCESNVCKSNFAMLKDSNDTDCYPNDQIIPNYIYNETTKYYEECYSSCKFCSKQKRLSSNLNHNCLTCKDGYLKSYEYMGNCYLIDNLNNNLDTLKIVNNRNQLYEEYNIIDFCLDKYIINSTGECVSECPTNTVFHTYQYDYQYYTVQEVTYFGKIYNLTEEKIPKYKFGNLCYKKCPDFTSIDERYNLCKCKFGWQQNSTTKEVICYDRKEYCLSKDYFYHIDTKECVLGGCRDEYFQFNFECYKNNCTENTAPISSDF